MFVFVPTPLPPSREAVELGEKIAEAVRILRAENPAIKPIDVRRGLQLAEAELRKDMGGTNMQQAMAIALLMVLMLGGVVAYMLAAGGGSMKQLVLILTIGIGAIAVVIAVVAARR